MNLIRREHRTPVANTAFVEPFGLMHNLLRWDPFGNIELPEIQSAYLPSFDIKETAGGYVFLADLPGVKQENLDINLTGNRLTISGKRENEERREGESYFATERSFGSFSRTFSLPEGVDGNGVKAELKNGVLTLTVPKVPEVQPKKITIQAS
jgi:HSP20 family protein